MFNSQNHKGRLISHLAIYLSRMSFQLYRTLLHTLYGHSSQQHAKGNQNTPARPAFTDIRTGNMPTVSILLFAMLLTACGAEESSNHNLDSSLSTPINRILTGTVAVGLPVKGAIIIIDTDGKTLNTQSNTNGTYSVNLDGRPGPYLIRVEPDDSNLPALYSYATGSGVTNITPFTTLALFLAYQGDFADSFNDWAAIHSNWSRIDLEQAHAKINANFATDLQNAGVDPVVYDFFTVPFEANQTGIDAFLDGYTVAFDYNAKAYDITDSSGQPVAFNENISTANYYIGARFLPEDATNWKLTWTPEFNGQPGATMVSYHSGNNIPWSEERFNEVFWTTLTETPSQTPICREGPNTSCNIDIRVTRLNTNYDVIGNGEIGTIVRGSGTYNWNMNGWYQQNGQPRQNINISTSHSFSWNWERIS